MVAVAAWHCYFLGTLLLHALGRLRVDPLASLALLVVAAFPLPEESAPRLRRWRGPVAAVAAAALLWRESWLPPPSAVWRFLTDPSVSPTPAYVAAFMLRAIDPPALAALAALCAAVVWLGRRVRLTFVCLVGLAAVAATDPAALGRSPAAREAADFFSAEARRSLRLGPPAGPAFDVVVVHACSLSWDDLRAVGAGPDAFAGGAHALLTGFTSATAYSNPAALRLLRAPCGQPRHAALFAPADPACYLLEQLRGLGYATAAANNHDGTYDHYAAVLSAHARADAPLDLAGVPVMKLNFNGTDIYEDEAVLAKWWAARQASGAPRAFLYYNTVSLHLGAHRPGQGGDWFGDRQRHYKEAFAELSAALERFYARVDASGRRVVVLVVAEHGAALDGSTLQPPDLREIPLPALVEVPVAVRLLGPGAPPLPARPLTAAAPAGYLALAELLSRLLKAPPFPGDLTAALAGLPETRLVAENEHALVLAGPGSVLVRRSGGRWTAVPSDGARSARPAAR